MQRAAGNEDTAIGRGGEQAVSAKGVLPTGATGIRSACGVESVVAGCQADIAARNDDMQALQPFIAFRNFDHAVRNGQRIVCGQGVVTRGNGKGSAAYGNVGVGMQGIIGRLDGKTSAADEQVSRRLDPLHAGALLFAGRGRRVAAASPAVLAAGKAVPERGRTLRWRGRRRRK